MEQLANEKIEKVPDRHQTAAEHPAAEDLTRKLKRGIAECRCLGDLRNVGGSPSGGGR